MSPPHQDFEATRRRAATIAASKALAALVLSAPTSAATTGLQAVFKEDRLGAAPARTCGDRTVSPGCSGGGEIVGLGAATESFEFLGAEPAPNGCVTTFGGTTIKLADGSGSFVTEERYLICSPGNGLAVKFTGVWAIVGGSGTGVFAGASGSGTIQGHEAGNALVLKYVGTITT